MQPKHAQVLHWLDCVFSFKAVAREVSQESITMALTLFGACEDPAVAHGNGEGAHATGEALIIGAAHGGGEAAAATAEVHATGAAHGGGGGTGGMHDGGTTKCDGAAAHVMGELQAAGAEHGGDAVPAELQTLGCQGIDLA